MLSHLHILNHSILTASVSETEYFLRNKDFDSIVCTGLSGSIFIGALSMQMRKNIICIRPKDHNSHGNLVEFEEIPRKWIFLDDLFDSGKTHRYIDGIMREKFGPSPSFVGTYMYGRNRYLSPLECLHYNLITPDTLKSSGPLLEKMEIMEPWNSFKVQNQTVQ